MKFLNWLGSLGLAIGSALDSQSELERQLAERPLLDDEEFYRRYYGSTDVPKDIPLRVRRILGEQLRTHRLRVRPEDNIPQIIDIDLAEIIWEIAEEFGVTVTVEEMRVVDGTFDSVVRFFADSCKRSQPR